MNRELRETQALLRMTAERLAGYSESWTSLNEGGRKSLGGMAQTIHNCISVMDRVRIEPRPTWGEGMSMGFVFGILFSMLLSLLLFRPY